MSKLSKPDLVLIVMALVYVLSPVDFIPELIAGPLGLTDDVAALAVITAIIMRSLGRNSEPEPARVVVPATVTYDSHPR